MRETGVSSCCGIRKRGDWEICGISGADPIPDPKHKCASPNCITKIRLGKSYCEVCERKKQEQEDLYWLKISSEGEFLGEYISRKRRKKYRTKTRLVLVNGELILMKCYIGFKRC